MPMLTIFTNLQRANIPKDFVSKILPVLAKSVNKPVERFTVSITTDCIQSINGDGEKPLIMASLESIGNLGPAENKVIAKSIAEFIEKELGVEQQRISLVFYDLKATNVARGSNVIGQ